MSKSFTTRKKAVSIAFGVFLICLAALSFTSSWWPGILLAFAISLGVKEFLRGRYYDLFLTLFIFIGLFTVFYLKSSWSIIVPVLFTVAGIWIISRELWTREKKIGRDVIDEVAQSILEEDRDESD